MKRTKSTISWIFRVLIFAGFFLASLGKLTNNPQVLEMFRNWGYPNGFHFLIGILEFCLGILLLIPKTLKLALVGLAIIMLGAIVTHLLNDPLLNLLRPIIFLIFLGAIYYFNFGK